MTAARRSACAAVALGVALMTPWTSYATAATQIGETFTPSSVVCPANFTLLQSVSPGEKFAAPSAGVITAWSHQAAGSDVPQLKLKVGRPEGGDTFTIVGESVVETPTPSTLNTYPVQIPVKAGDVIGIYTATSGRCGAGSGITHRHHVVMGDPSPGTTATYGVGSLQLDVSAALEPDCDNDGLGDETQDPMPACPRMLSVDASKNKVKKGKKVTFSGQLTEIVRQACQSGQAVQLQRKKPAQAAFTTFEQLQTDAAGGFSTTEKVKKTFEYRAQVAETATCGGQVSNTEKVKVKKKPK